MESLEQLLGGSGSGATLTTSPTTPAIPTTPATATAAQFIARHVKAVPVNRMQQGQHLQKVFLALGMIITMVTLWVRVDGA